MSCTLEQVYDAQEQLFRGEDIPHNLSVLLTAAHAEAVPVRAMAAQSIPQWGHLHTQHDTVLDTHIDLCEDRDASVRLYAIRGLAVLCKQVTSLVGKVADVLGQLAATGDQKELTAVKQGLTQVLQLDGKAALESLFRLVKQDGETRNVLVPIVVEAVKDAPEALLDWIGEQVIAIANLKDIDGDVFLQILNGIRNSKAKEEKKMQVAVNAASKWFVVQSEFDVSHFDALVELFKSHRYLFANEELAKQYLVFSLGKVPTKFSKLTPTQSLTFLRTVAVLLNFHTTPVISRELFPLYIALVRKYKPEAKALEKTHVQFVEALLFVFNHLAFKSSTAAKENTGIFVHFGQPDDKDPQWEEKRNEFLNHFSKIQNEGEGFIKTIAEVIKSSKAEFGKLSNEEEKADMKAKAFILETAKLAAENSLKILLSVSKKEPSFFAPNKLPPSWIVKRQSFESKRKDLAPKAEQDKIVKIKRSGKQKEAAPAKEESRPAKSAAPKRKASDGAVRTVEIIEKKSEAAAASSNQKKTTKAAPKKRAKKA